MILDQTMTITFGPLGVRSDGTAYTGFITRNITARSDNGQTISVDTPDARQSVSFTPANRGFTTGLYKFRYCIIETLDGRTLKGPYSDPVDVTFEAKAPPAKPAPMTISQ